MTDLFKTVSCLNINPRVITYRHTTHRCHFSALSTFTPDGNGRTCNIFSSVVLNKGSNSDNLVYSAMCVTHYYTELNQIANYKPAEDVSDKYSSTLLCLVSDESRSSTDKTVA